MIRTLITIICLIFFSCTRSIEKTEEKYPSGKVKIIGIYENDTLIANKKKLIKFYESGNKKSECPIVNEKNDGNFRCYFESGNISQEGRYINGLIDGEVLYYYDNKSKKIKCSMLFIKGKNVRQTIFYENGQKEIELSFKEKSQFDTYTQWYENGNLKLKTNDCWNGFQTEWYSNKIKKAEGKFKGGGKFGKWIYYDSTGKISDSVFYKSSTNSVILTRKNK